MSTSRSVKTDSWARTRGERSAQARLLSVDEVQHDRLLCAALRECAAEGVANVTVTGIVGSAGVSRRTFYELFPDVQRCVLAALEDCLARAGSIAHEASEEHERWRDRVRAGLGALLCHFEQEPEAGRVLLVGALSAGPEALARRRQVLATLAGVLDEGRVAWRPRVADPPAAGPPALIGEGLVGAVLSVLHDRFVADASPQLSELVNPLMFMIVAPYLGAGAARRELRRPVSTAAAGSPRRTDPFRQLPMRLTYRTMRVLLAIGSEPGSSNRQVAIAAGIGDQGQTSKMLIRLRALGLIENAAVPAPKAGANAWTLTANGRQVERAIATPVRRHGTT